MTADPDAETSRAHRAATIAAFRQLTADWHLKTRRFVDEGPRFAPAVVLTRAGGQHLATVAAHASGLSVLLGVDEKLHDLDDLPCEAALNAALRLVEREYAPQ